MRAGVGFRTCKAGHANLWVRHFGGGVADVQASTTALPMILRRWGGWRLRSRSKVCLLLLSMFMLIGAVTGDQLLVALVEPTEGLGSQVEKVRDISAGGVKGFELELENGHVVACLCSLEEAVA